MKKLLITTGLITLAGCAQFTTNSEERAALSGRAEQSGESYIQCIKQEAQRLLSASQDAAFLVDTAKSGCTSQLAAYESTQAELLKTEYIMVGPQLEKSVKILDERARSAVAEMIVAQGASGSSLATARAAPGGSVSTKPAATSSGFKPTFNQRVYINCMEDQAQKYVRLNETAAAIADVAASRCRPHLIGDNQAALEQEGRALVMGSIFDARLEGGQGRQSRPGR